MKKLVKDLKETEKFGEILGSLLKAGDVICLIGDLGAGKTTLTKAIGKGLGIEDYITSPTFSIINEYKGIINLNHLDVYRLNHEDDLLDLGYEDYFYSDNVTIIEWGDKVKTYLPKETIYINIEKGQGLEERIITITSLGKRFEEIKRELVK